MTLLHFIVPREKRVIIYFVLNDEIINSNQQKIFPTEFKVDSMVLINKKMELIAATTEIKNLYSFIYIHKSGQFEIEINVVRPKYMFHENYND